MILIIKMTTANNSLDIRDSHSLHALREGIIGVAGAIIKLKLLSFLPESGS